MGNYVHATVCNSAKMDTRLSYENEYGTVLPF